MLEKYRSVTQALDGSPLHWSRLDVDGLPFKGMPPEGMKSRELDLALTPAMDVYVRMYDLSDPEQRREYELVIDRAANGWYNLIRCDVRFLPDEKKWQALVEFGERYMTLAHRPAPPRWIPSSDETLATI